MSRPVGKVDPGQIRQHGNSCAGGNPGKSLFRSRFTVSKLVTSDDDGNQACDFCNRSREQRLHLSEGMKVVARIKELTKGIGADSVLECVGTQESMMQVNRRVQGGYVSYVGVPHPLEHAE